MIVMVCVESAAAAVVVDSAEQVLSAAIVCGRCWSLLLLALN